MNYETITLEKGMYATGKGFTQVLEELDPSENYKGSALEGLDAYQRQLKRFDIHVSGAGSDTVQKFFATTASSALFPEFISRAVRTGMEEADSLDKIIATTTKINSMDYRSITSMPTAAQKELKEVSEGTAIDETSVNVSDKLVTLKKRGRILSASYEALKFQRLDLFAVTLRQIGAYIARQQQADAIGVLKDGDGNENPAAQVDFASASALTYNDLLNLWNALYPHNLTTLIMSPDTMVKLLKIEEFKNPLTGLNFQGTGKAGTPMGADLVKASCLTASDPIVIGLDKRYALEKVVASDVLVESDKLIDRQIERTSITTIAGFSKIFNDAVKVLGEKATM